MAQNVVSQSEGVIISASDMITQLADWSVGALLGLWFQSVFVGLCTQILFICIFLVIYGRMIEVYLVTSIGPIPFAAMVNRKWGSTGQNYLRSQLALGFQAFLIMICVGIYALLVEGYLHIWRQHICGHLGLHELYGSAVLDSVQDRQPGKINVWGALTSSYKKASVTGISDGCSIKCSVVQYPNALHQYIASRHQESQKFFFHQNT